METLQISAADVLGEIRAIAMARATEALTVRDGELAVRGTEELDENTRAAIASIERSAGGIKVKFYDKLKALELLGKHLGLFETCGAPDEAENDLLDAILQSTKEVIPTHDIPELQQAAAAGNDLVEPPGVE